MTLPPIAAIGTPFGKGALCVLRLSGEGCAALVRKVFFPKKQRVGVREAVYGEIRDAAGEMIDDGILVLYAAPHSYTGEDMAEISCHGGTVVAGMVLRALLDAGARLAQPGEFTRRAFAAGKLSLSRAEGIADLIDARTDAAARLARKEASGALAAKTDALCERLTALLAALCVVLDYPEERLTPPAAAALNEELEALVSELSALLSTLSASRAVTEGIPAFIVGRVNVGKSSFFNALLGEERAIVTEIPGTTRDLIEVPLQAGKLLLRLTDTAGLREARDKVERIGIERVKKRLEASVSCLIFALFDLGEAATGEDEKLISFLREIRERHLIVPVLTKTDKKERFDRALVSEFGEPFCVSLLEPCDFAPLFLRLENAYIEDEDALLRGEVLSNLRQYDCAKRALDALSAAGEHLTDAENDICITLLEEALCALSEIDGRTAAGLVADEIFKRFCVGK